mmetsp:Transcript_18768/g.37782  ORF Transcript_18768/g.37782 Transcript_18768/m.37782 type:complete len:91 (-) Transcript_18768:95-367(-)
MHITNKQTWKAVTIHVIRPALKLSKRSSIERIISPNIDGGTVPSRAGGSSSELRIRVFPHILSGIMYNTAREGVGFGGELMGRVFPIVRM